MNVIGSGASILESVISAKLTVTFPLGSLSRLTVKVQLTISVALSDILLLLRHVPCDKLIPVVSSFVSVKRILAGVKPVAVASMMISGLLI